MSKKIPGSVVLQLDSEGHCTLSSPSACTHRIVREYFSTGDLLAVGSVCQPNERPLIGHVTDSKDGLSLLDEVPRLI